MIDKGYKYYPPEMEPRLTDEPWFWNLLNLAVVVIILGVVLWLVI